MANTPSKSPGVTARDAATGSYQFTHADFTYVRRKRKPPEEHESGELNIVPYLDILVNLIMFLLVSQATLVSLGVVDVTAPSYAPPGPGPEPKPDEEKGKDLKLTLGVAKDGYYIAAKGGVLPGEEPPPEGGELSDEGIQRREPTIPIKPDGTYDYAALTRKLRAIKTVFPGASAVYLAADANINYQVIVKTLDASRKDAKGDLFPNVAFSKIN